MEYLGAWGTLIHEKNLKSKISCQTPFNRMQDLHRQNIFVSGVLNMFSCSCAVLCYCYSILCYI
jgi:hypothetical protein